MVTAIPIFIVLLFRTLKIYKNLLEFPDICCIVLKVLSAPKCVIKVQLSTTYLNECDVD